MSGTLTPQPLAFTVSGTGKGQGTLYRPASALDESYADEADLFLLALPQNVGFDFGDAVLAANLIRASREADVFLMHRFVTPLQHYSRAFVGWICDLTAYYVMEVRGYNPDNNEESRFLRKYKLAEKRITAAQAYMITPDKELLLAEQPQPATPYSYASSDPTCQSTSKRKRNGKTAYA